ncbi:MAG: radical SAM protein, partial [Lachnospiraceae bacterium]|nr:radical SAM protein [Lachnospiraceae bacterium]
MLEKGIICFYDRVIVQQGEKYTILHNPNVLKTDRITTETYIVVKFICDNRCDLQEVYKHMETNDDLKYFQNIIKRLYNKKIIKYADEKSEYYDLEMQIDWDLSNKCNLKCKHCCVSADITSEELPLEEMYVIADKINQIKPNHIVISGGEPLIRKDFTNIIDRLKKEYKGKLSLMTNAILLNKKLAEYIVQNFDGVSVSLDGVNEQTCSIIRGEGTFEKTISGIRLLQAAGMKKISASMVITRYTENKRKEFKELCENMKIEPVIRGLEFVGRAKEEMKDFVTLEEEVSDQTLLQQVQASQRKIKQGEFTLFGCGAAYKQFQIDYRGYIYPCQCLMEDELILGNILNIDDCYGFIRERQFRDSAGYKKLRQYFPYNFIECNGCNKQIFCWNCIATLYRKPQRLEQCDFCKLAYENFFVRWIDVNYSIWVTSTCNLKCRYCYVKEERGNRSFDKELVPNLIEFIKNTNNEDEVTVSFFGGEPLLEISLMKEIIGHMEKESGFQTRYYMTTNGVLLNQEIINYIKEKQIILSLSWDGNKKANDMNRMDVHGNGTYEKIKESYRLLKKNDVDVRVRATFDSQTMFLLKDSMEDLYNIDQEMDVIFVPDYFDKGWTEEKLQKLQEDIRIIEEKNIENFMIIGDKKLRKSQCSGGINNYHIYIDGKVYPCSFVVNNKEFLIGNVVD